MKYFYNILYEGIECAKKTIDLAIVQENKDLYVYGVGQLDATLKAIQSLPVNQQVKFQQYLKQMER